MSQKTEPIRESGSSETAPLSLTKKLSFSLLVFMIPVLFLGAAEVGVRFAMPKVSSLNQFVVTPEQREEAKKTEDSPIFEGDPYLLWKLKPNLDKVYWDFSTVSTNSSGFRAESSDRDIMPKTDDLIRIVCLGDSVTFGFRTPLTYPTNVSYFDPNSLPYPMLVERHLRAANPTKKIEVITMAVPGYTSTQGRMWLLRDIDKLKPDLVTASFGWNDSSLTLMPDRETLSEDISIYISRWLFDRSQLYANLVTWSRESEAEKDTAKPKAPVRPMESRTSLDEYVANMTAIADAAASRQIPYVVIAAPFRDQVEKGTDQKRMQQNRLALRELFRNTGRPFIETYQLTEDAYPANDAFFGERIHPSAIGHRLMAAELVRWMQANWRPEGIEMPHFTQ